MLIAVPSLRQLLDIDSLKPLSATCRVLHSWFNEQVTIIKLQDGRDIGTMQKAKWPNLTEIRHSAMYISKLLQEVLCFHTLCHPYFRDLGSTCSQLHETTHQAVQIIIMPQVDHLQRLRARSYPTLRLVVVVDRAPVSHRLSHTGKRWKSLLSLEVENCGECIAYFLPPSTNMRNLSNADHQLFERPLSRFVYLYSEHAKAFNGVVTQAGARSLGAACRAGNWSRIKKLICMAATWMPWLCLTWSKLLGQSCLF